MKLSPILLQTVCGTKIFAEDIDGDEGDLPGDDGDQNMLKVVY